MKWQILERETFASVVAGFISPPSVDFETNGLPFENPASRVVGVSLAGWHKPYESAPATEYDLDAWYIPIAHQTGTNCDPKVVFDLVAWFSQTALIVFALTLEQQFARVKWGASLRIVGDGFLASRLLQRPDTNLKALAREVLARENVLTLEDVLGKGRFDFSMVSAQDVDANVYVLADALNAFELEHSERQELERRGMRGAYELELLAAQAMAEQSVEGYLVKRPLFIRAVAAEGRRVQELAVEIYKDLGTKPFLINSPVQLGKVLKAQGITSPLKTAGDHDSWSQEALALIDNPPPVIAKIIDWKSAFSVTNALSRSPLMEIDGLAHPYWETMGVTGTPRMYAHRPPLTSLPKAARAAFVAPTGKRWMMMQWLQPEVRIAAAESGDPALVALLNTEYDFFTTVGATLRKAEPGEGTEEDRDTAKRLTYAIFDGAGSPPFVAHRLRVSEMRAVKLVEQYFGLFPGLDAFLLRLAANPTHEVTSWLGRRWTQKPPMGKEERFDYTADAFLKIRQHGVATWLKITLCRMLGHYEAKHPALAGFGQIIPVFDTLFYVVDERVPIAPHISYLKNVAEPLINGVRMRAQYGVGPSWGEISVIDDLAFAQAIADFHSSQPSNWPVQ